LAEKAHIKYGRLMANQASDLIEKGKYEEAKHLLHEANKIEPRSNQFLMLGKIARREGDTLKARQYFETALKATDRQFDVLIYKELSELQYEQQNYKESRRMLWMADSLVYAQSEQAQSMPLTLLQQEYDQSIVSLAASQRLNRWLAGLLALIVMLAVGIIFYLLKVRKLKSVLSENVQQYNETLLTVSQMESAEKLSQQRISAQESSMAQMSSELTNLNKLVDRQKRRLEQQRKEMAKSLGRGKELYGKAERGEPFAHFQSVDEQSFIDYYAFSNSERFARLMMVYGTPTRRLATYLILRDMGKNSAEIKRILSVSSATIRSYKYRLGFKED
jgi:tetratricopeptide (TPR) repeat protein